jgi:hypothetical protein
VGGDGPRGADATQLAAKAGWTPKGSNLRNRLSELSQARPGRISAHRHRPADAGRRRGGARARHGETLIESIRAVLTGPQRGSSTCCSSMPGGAHSRSSSPAASDGSRRLESAQPPVRAQPARARRISGRGEVPCRSGQPPGEIMSATRCAIYARFSSDRQNERSAEDQVGTAGGTPIRKAGRSSRSTPTSRSPAPRTGGPG